MRLIPTYFVSVVVKSLLVGKHFAAHFLNNLLYKLKYTKNIAECMLQLKKHSV